MLSFYQELVDRSAIRLDPEERLLWAGKPQKAPYLLNSFWSALRLMVIVCAFIALLSFFPEVDPQYPAIAGLVVLFILLHALYRLATWRRTVYAVTNTRIIIHKRHFYVNISYIPFTDIYTKELTKSFADKRGNTRSIVFSCKNTSLSDSDYQLYCFRSIEGAEEVFELVKTSPEP